MSGFCSLRIWLFCGILALSAGYPTYGSAQQQPQPGEKVAAPAASAEALPRMLAEGGTALEKEAEALKSRTGTLQKALSQAEKDFQEQKAAIAALSANLAVKKLTLPQGDEAAKAYAVQAEKIGSQLQELTRELEGLKKEQQDREAAQVNLKAEVARLQATKHQVTRTREMQQAYQRYLRAAAAQQQAAAQVLEALKKRAALWEQQGQELATVQADLKKFLDETWKTELLKRQEPVSLREQLGNISLALAALPGRAGSRLEEAYSSGALGAFLREHSAPITGLIIFIILAAWGSRRLSTRISPHLAEWQTRVRGLGLKTLVALGQLLSQHLLLIGVILWVWLCWWSLGLSGFAAARAIPYLAVAWGGLALGRQLLRVVFAGREAGGLLPLDQDTARFYRRSLQVFLAYLVLGLWGLASAPLLSFPQTGILFMGHLFRLGLLGWALWLMRKQRLAPLLKELPGPRWLHSRALLQTLRGLVLLLLVTVILGDLLGFHFLANYVAQAAALTGVTLILLGLLWLGAGRVLHFLLHPEFGYARRCYPGQEEVLQRLYGLAHIGLTLILAVAALLGALRAWSIEPGKLAWVVAWLTWGPTLGSIQLTPLNLGLTALVLYLVSGLSRQARCLMQTRVYPRTGWDTGIQYTISTTLHYSILIIGVLAALNILGFPLTNLALVAGALGVGIGFGLQNIVNNFISGLILLFERPIKVGDILVIDGQWGAVKEIRVRSTVFETYDRYVLIIPNSELLSGKILNWTHYGHGVNRLTLKVGVSYNTDVRQVTHLLTEICRANSRVVHDPAPQIYFAAYGDNSLDFTIWVFLKTPADRIPATHELNSAIFDAFQKHGIEIPFPQRDLYIKNWPPALGG